MMKEINLLKKYLGINEIGQLQLIYELFLNDENTKHVINKELLQQFMKAMINRPNTVVNPYFFTFFSNLIHHDG